MEFEDRKIITVDITDIAQRHSIIYGASLGQWRQFIVEIESLGYISFEAEYEHGYYDSIERKFSGQRRETATERDERQLAELSNIRRKNEEEKAEYKRLKEKFGNKS